MSYSFTVTADTKEAVMAKVRAELDAVGMQQPAHSLDIDKGFEAACSFVGMLAEVDPKEHHITVSLHGSVGWQYDAANPTGVGAPLNQVSIGCSAWHVPAKAHTNDELDLTI